MSIKDTSQFLAEHRSVDRGCKCITFVLDLCADTKVFAVNVSFKNLLQCLHDLCPATVSRLAFVASPVSVAGITLNITVPTLCFMISMSASRLKVMDAPSKLSVILFAPALVSLSSAVWSRVALVVPSGSFTETATNSDKHKR